MVIDEGHMLRNMNSQRYQQLMRIRADSRLLLTGTPLQNNLVELVSVLTFVMPKLFGQHIEAFKTHFQGKSLRRKISTEALKSAISLLHQSYNLASVADLGGGGRRPPFQ